MIMKNLILLSLVCLFFGFSQNAFAQTCNDPNAHNTGEMAPCETCFDGIKNGDEIEVDCGGTNPSCPPCDFERRLDVLGDARVLGDLEVQRNIGIGTNDAKEKLQIGDRFTFHDGGSKFIGYNVFFDGAENRRIVTGSTSKIAFTSDGSISLESTGSGAANSIPDFNTKLRFFNTGEIALSEQGEKRLELDHSSLGGFASANGFNFGTLGVILENFNSESAGFYGGPEFAMIWSPGDGDRLFRVFDEDGMQSTQGGERWYVDGDGDTFKTSDANLKKDVKTLEQSIQKLQQLRGVSFTWKKNSEELAKGDVETPSIGVIAQELEQVFPELVGTNEQGRKFVDYDGLAPILIEAVKEQQSTIEELEVRLQKLETLLLGKTDDQQLNQQSTTLTDAKLYPNQPNPFSEQTLIRYYIPEGSKQAELRIANMEGKVIKTVAIQESGEGQLTVNAHSLSAGTYLYSLLINGELIATEKMILTGKN